MKGDVDIVLYQKGDKSGVLIHGKCPNCGAELHLETYVSRDPGFSSDMAVFYCKKCGYELTRARDDWMQAKESDTVGVRWE